MPSRTQFVWLALAVAASVVVVCFPPLLEIEGRLVVADSAPGYGMSTDDLWDTHVYSSTPVGRDRPLLREHSTAWTTPNRMGEKEGVEWYVFGNVLAKGGASIPDYYQQRFRYTTDTTRLLAELALIAGVCGVLCSLSRGRPKERAATSPIAA